MIDITEFEEKLDRLKEYMALRIDGKGKVFSININALPVQYTAKQLIDMYLQMGIHFWQSDHNDYVPPRELSFEEWLQLNTNKDLKS